MRRVAPAVFGMVFVGWLLLLAPPDDRAPLGDPYMWAKLNAPLHQWIRLGEHESQRACEEGRQSIARRYAARGRLLTSATDKEVAIDEYLITLELQCVASTDVRLQPQ